jgi:drug/metabolite transporter (DMT)-like permease
MNKVHDLAALKMHNMKLRILDKNFWIIVFLFGTLAAIIVILSLTGNQPESGVNSLLPSLDTGKMGAGYQLFIQELNSTPISVAAILLATSTLIFIERFLSKKKILS